MTEENFWTLMTETNLASGGDPTDQQELLAKKLQELPPREIIDFDNYFATLMSNAYTWELWGAAYMINGGCSDDCFSDFRGWLIGQGREVYEKALLNPDSLSEHEHLEPDMEMEGYSYLAFTAYENKTGQEMPANAVAHPADPKGDEWEEAELEKLFPNLAVKFDF